MIKLRNGAEVLRADLQADPGDKSASGYVVARAYLLGEFVTWYVARVGADDEWEAYHGHYFRQNQAAAFADYDERRGVVRQSAQAGRS